MNAELIELQQTAQLSTVKAAQLFGVTLQTWQHYRAGRTRPPRAVLLYMNVLTGHMPWRGWEKFTVSNGQLFPPGARDGYRPEVIGGLFFTLQELQTLRAKNARPAQYYLDFAA